MYYKYYMPTYNTCTVQTMRDKIYNLNLCRYFNCIILQYKSRRLNYLNQFYTKMNNYTEI